jgi:signal transduction histidine kinase
VDVNLVLRTVVHKLRMPPGICLQWEDEPNLPEIMADTMFLTEVFHNIIVNALEAMTNQPLKELRIGNRLRSDEVEIWISDTGHGILAEHLQKVFQPEFTTKAGKHGIGLWFCETVVRIHGGHIDVDSSPGHGTTFTVVLPVGGEEP